MKNFLHIVSFLSLGLIVVAATSSAQSSAGGNGGNPKGIGSISVAKTQDMQFGAVVRSAAGGTVTINPNTAQVIYSGVTRGQTITYHPASFSVTGEPNYEFSVRLPKKANLSRAGGKKPMSVVDFTATAAGGQLDNKGTATFNVGATLEVGANQETGSYSGSFTVMVEYQ